MRYILVPEPIAFTDFVTGAPIPDERKPDMPPLTMAFQEFVLARVKDPNFTEGKDPVEAIEYILEVRRKLLAQDWAPGSVITVEDEEWRRLAESTRHPKGGYLPLVRHDLPPHINAVLQAKAEPPAALASPSTESETANA